MTADDTDGGRKPGKNTQISTSDPTVTGPFAHPSTSPVATHSHCHITAMMHACATITTTLQAVQTSHKDNNNAHNMSCANLQGHYERCEPAMTATTTTMLLLQMLQTSDNHDNDNNNNNNNNAAAAASGANPR
ncbi:hypothetical protein CVT25_004709 [Psilocybe cyanescens]|uniref:Uncharacterized protein n=1 Tax=Psilocybe cyanescens TaxID=93625 RepID=A0A409XIR8_PSICY|nr:hypothetical protein CVT25_004709 [Psilocybe cyanescens]